MALAPCGRGSEVVVESRGLFGGQEGGPVAQSAALTVLVHHTPVHFWVRLLLDLLPSALPHKSCAPIAW